MTHVRHTFLAALERVRPVLAAEVTSGSWERPSQLREMTVGTVAAHLLRALTTVSTYLAAPQPEGAPIDPAAYYVTILRNSDLHDPVHVGIRERAQRESDRGPAGVVSSWDGTVSELARLLVEEPEDRTLEVAGDLVMRLDDYLVTRLVEVVVHADDLAVSVGLDTPSFDPSAIAWSSITSSASRACGMVTSVCSAPSLAESVIRCRRSRSSRQRLPRIRTCNTKLRVTRIARPSLDTSVCEPPG